MLPSIDSFQLLPIAAFIVGLLCWYLSVIVDEQVQIIPNGTAFPAFVNERSLIFNLCKCSWLATG